MIGWCCSFGVLLVSCLLDGCSGVYRGEGGQQDDDGKEAGRGVVAGENAMKDSHDHQLFLTEELMILQVIDEEWQRESLPDDLVFVNQQNQNLLANDVLDARESERKEKEETTEKWNHHGLSQYT